jgi:cyanophycinase
MIAAVLGGAFAKNAGLSTAKGAAPPAAKVARTALAPRFFEGSGTLVIVGGGSLPDAIRDRFLQLAGGKKARLVVIPTASGRRNRLERSYRYWKAQAQGAESVVMLDTSDRVKANDPEFVKPLRQATGVWMGGGDQARLVSAYRGTAVERELLKVLARGGVIGGTSAGASVMSSVMILGGNPLPKLGTGFGFLPRVVVDQHFQNRKRLNRLLNVLAAHPECMGLGIDEQTAAVVSGRTVTVLGNANVRVCLRHSPREAPSVQVLKSGQVLDLGWTGRPWSKSSSGVEAGPARTKPPARGEAAPVRRVSMP